MFNPKVKRVLFACVVTLLAPTMGRAQFPAPDALKETIAGSGTVRLRRPPALLRVHVQLTAKGKTLEEALGSLKQRREAAVARLEKLGADKQSIALGNPAVSNPQNAQQRKIEMMVAQRMGSRGAKSKAVKPVKLPVAVAALLTAQWPLEGDSPEKLLVAAEALREKVRAAELAGPKEADTLTPEEQEVAEEMSGSRDPFDGSGDEQQVLPGQPQFVYVAKLAVKDREKGMADAFAKAKAQAAELAKAAGVPLGPLAGLAGRAGGRNTPGDDEFGGYNRHQYMFLQRAAMMQNLAGTDESPDEVAAVNMESLVFEFQVMAVFGMGKQQ